MVVYVVEVVVYVRVMVRFDVIVCWVRDRGSME